MNFFIFFFCRYIIVSSEDWSKLAHFYDSDCTIKFAVQFNANHEKYIESDPKCCETCYAQLKQIEQESLLNYEKATIHVRRIQSKCDTEDVNDDQSGLDDDRSDKSFGDVSADHVSAYQFAT